MPYRVGQTATNPKTGEKLRFDGQNWVSVGGTTPIKKGGGDPQTRAYLNDLSSKAADAAEAMRIYDAAEQPLKKLHPGPGRGRLMEIATPEEGGGLLDTIGGVLVGGPARALGAITPDETDAYQKIRGYQSRQVLQAQLAQKGVQSESDAARMQLTELSPSKSLDVNMDVINRGRDRARRAQARAIFYSRFANDWGLNGVDRQGRTADQIWAQEADKLTNEILGPPKNSKSRTITVLSRTKVK